VKYAERCIPARPERCCRSETNAGKDSRHGWNWFNAHDAGGAGAFADKEQRFPLLKLEQLNDQQRPLADEILKVSSIEISGPFNMMLRSPVMGQRMFAMLDYLRFNTSVPRKLNGFAILIQARLWTSQVAWTSHYPLALRAGLQQAVADDLKVGKRPASMQPDEAAVGRRLHLEL
jgi:4-carboxymuconolactone decarboxylase